MAHSRSESYQFCQNTTASAEENTETLWTKKLLEMANSKTNMEKG
jgi:hypothetical protein